MNNELYHYGVIGMKWGVRRYQNYDGTRIKTSQKQYSWEKKNINDKAKAYFDSDLDTTRSFKAKSDADLQEFKRATQGMDVNSKEYHKLLNAYDIELRDSEKAFYKDFKAEKDSLIGDILSSQQIKEKLRAAKSYNKQIDKFYDQTLGEKSPYFNDAYKEWSKKNGNDSYGFFHYEWNANSDNKYYQEAYKEYRQLADSAGKKYRDVVSDIGKEILGVYADQKWAGSKNTTYMDVAELELDQIIQFPDKYIF